MATSNTYSPLVDEIWADNSLVRNALLVFAGSIALWISAKVQIPFPVVPLTLQTLVVLVVGMAYGWKLAGATVVLYLLEGAMGLPVFANTPEKGIGLAYMMGTTGGYLLGFLIAAVTVGYLAERGWDRNIFTTAAAMFIGNVLIYVPGLLWLGSVAGWENPILKWGLTPFLMGDLFKLILAALFMPMIWSFIKSRKH